MKGCKKSSMNTLQHIDVSVIICTRNRVHAIGSCLDACLASIQNCAHQVCEIVIVDNGSTDGTGDYVKKWASDKPVPVTIAYEAQAGLSNARNCGLKNAKGDLFVFTDDDCHLDKNYISEAVNYDANDTIPVLRGGSVHLGDSTDQPLTIKYLTERTQWKEINKVSKYYNLGNSILGCNMTMRRTLADKVGEFDIFLGAGSPIPGGEDTDYIFRAYLANFPIEYVPDMRVYHFHGRKEQEDGYKLFRNYSIGGGALYAKYMFIHPDFCRQLYWDTKNAIKEIIQNKNLFEPQFNFSLRDKVLYCLKGMFMYWNFLIQKKFLHHKSK